MVKLKQIIEVLQRESGDAFMGVVNKAIRPFRVIDVNKTAEELFGLVNGEIVIEKQPATDSGAGYERFETDLLAYWNGFVARHPNLAGVLKISPERRKKLKMRYASVHFKENIKHAIDKIGKSPFLLGQKGWKASFDYIIANDTNYVKILEGKYEDSMGGIHKFIKHDNNSR